ncbi:unnamed protein product [Symbiodinium sp. CCMP2592]|nr:unnamed protein product [Symbiodinium sp. CCMP2592]
MMHAAFFEDVEMPAVLLEDRHLRSRFLSIENMDSRVHAILSSLWPAARRPLAPFLVLGVDILDALDLASCEEASPPATWEPEPGVAQEIDGNRELRELPGPIPPSAAQEPVEGVFRRDGVGLQGDWADTGGDHPILFAVKLCGPAQEHRSLAKLATARGVPSDTSEPRMFHSAAAVIAGAAIDLLDRQYRDRFGGIVNGVLSREGPWVNVPSALSNAIFAKDVEMPAVLLEDRSRRAIGCTDTSFGSGLKITASFKAASFSEMDIRVQAILSSLWPAARRPLAPFLVLGVDILDALDLASCEEASPPAIWEPAPSAAQELDGSRVGIAMGFGRTLGLHDYTVPFLLLANYACSQLVCTGSALARPVGLCSGTGGQGRRRARSLAKLATARGVPSDTSEPRMFDSSATAMAHDVEMPAALLEVAGFGLGHVKLFHSSCHPELFVAGCASALAPFLVLGVDILDALDLASCEEASPPATWEPEPGVAQEIDGNRELRELPGPIPPSAAQEPVEGVFRRDGVGLQGDWADTGGDHPILFAVKLCGPAQEHRSLAKLATARGVPSDTSEPRMFHSAAAVIAGAAIDLLDRQYRDRFGGIVNGVLSREGPWVNVPAALSNAIFAKDVEMPDVLLEDRHLRSRFLSIENMDSRVHAILSSLWPAARRPLAPFLVLGVAILDALDLASCEEASPPATWEPEPGVAQEIDGNRELRELPGPIPPSAAQEPVEGVFRRDGVGLQGWQGETGQTTGGSTIIEIKEGNGSGPGRDGAPPGFVWPAQEHRSLAKLATARGVASDTSEPRMFHSAAAVIAGAAIDLLDRQYRDRLWIGNGVLSREGPWVNVPSALSNAIFAKDVEMPAVLLEDRHLRSRFLSIENMDSRVHAILSSLWPAARRPLAPFLVLGVAILDALDLASCEEASPPATWEPEPGVAQEIDGNRELRELPGPIPPSAAQEPVEGVFRRDGVGLQGDWADTGGDHPILFAVKLCGPAQEHRSLAKLATARGVPSDTSEPRMFHSAAAVIAGAAIDLLDRQYRDRFGGIVNGVLSREGPWVNVPSALSNAIFAKERKHDVHLRSRFLSIENMDSRVHAILSSLWPAARRPLAPFLVLGVDILDALDLASCEEASPPATWEPEPGVAQEIDGNRELRELPGPIPPSAAQEPVEGVFRRDGVGLQGDWADTGGDHPILFAVKLCGPAQEHRSLAKLATARGVPSDTSEPRMFHSAAAVIAGAAIDLLDRQYRDRFGGIVNGVLSREGPWVNVPSALSNAIFAKERKHDVHLRSRFLSIENMDSRVHAILSSLWPAARRPLAPFLVLGVDILDALDLASCEEASPPATWEPEPGVAQEIDGNRELRELPGPIPPSAAQEPVEGVFRRDGVGLQGDWADTGGDHPILFAVKLCGPAQEHRSLAKLATARGVPSDTSEPRMFHSAAAVIAGAAIDLLDRQYRDRFGGIVNGVLSREGPWVNVPSALSNAIFAKDIEMPAVLLEDRSRRAIGCTDTSFGSGLKITASFKAASFSEMDSRVQAILSSLWPAARRPLAPFLVLGVDILDALDLASCEEASPPATWEPEPGAAQEIDGNRELRELPGPIPPSAAQEPVEGVFRRDGVGLQGWQG